LFVAGPGHPTGVSRRFELSGTQKLQIVAQCRRRSPLVSAGDIGTDRAHTGWAPHSRQVTGYCDAAIPRANGRFLQSLDVGGTRHSRLPTATFGGGGR